MSLTTRLSAFFLISLAIVLAGFVAILHLLARSHLHQHLDERLEASMQTLVAATDISEDGVEWELPDRQISLGHGPELDQIRWIVRDETGKIKDRSPNLKNDASWESDDAIKPLATMDAFFVLKEGSTWRVKQVALHAPITGRSSAPTDNPKTDAKRERHHDALTITAGFSLAPLERTLQRLTWTAAGISLGLWLLAALLGRWVSRQALVPVTRMARAVRSIDAAALDQRLPCPGTHDELHDLATAFNDLLSRLQEAFIRQARFTGDASHQLRTPLTALLGQIEVALRRERSPEEYQQVLSTMQTQAVQLRQLVEMLLFLARADAESKRPHLETVDLADWLPRHLETWSEHGRRHDFRVETGTNLPLWVNVQTPLLGQLVDNLLDNACKYSQPNTPIVLRCGIEEGRVLLMVQDVGCGIAAEDLPHIFEPFYRSAAARQRGLAGVGLGLSIAQRIAVVFGGSISAESEPGGATRFTLCLPLTTRQHEDPI